MRRTTPVNEAWLNAVSNLSSFGKEASARGLCFKEIIGGSIQCDMTRSALSVISRKIGFRFMVAEAWWIMSGKNDLRSIEKYSKAIGKFSDDGLFFFGSYGPKVIDQLPYVISALKQDPGSRRAVINIWREKPTDSSDYPCTLSVQWLIRDNLLMCLDTMRSSDIWLGTPYDLFNFSCLSAFLLLSLRAIDPRFKEIELGQIIMTCGSQHLYDINYTQAIEVLSKPEAIKYAPLDLAEFVSPWDFLDNLEMLKDRKDSGHKWLRELLIESKEPHPGQ